MTVLIYRMMFFCSLAMVIATATAHANPLIYSEKLNKHWDIGCHNLADTGEFSHCYMAATYSSDEIVMFMISGNEEMEFKILSNKWNTSIKADKSYTGEISFYKNGKYVTSYTLGFFGRIENDGMHGFQHNSALNHEWFANIAENHQMTMKIGKENIGTFNLPKTKVTILELYRLVDKFKKEYPIKKKKKDFDFNSYDFEPV